MYRCPPGKNNSMFRFYRLIIMFMPFGEASKQAIARKPGIKVVKFNFFIFQTLFAQKLLMAHWVT